MEFFKQNTRIDFLGLRKWAAAFSILLFAASMLSLSIHGLNWGLDFTGGTQIEVSFAQPANLNLIRQELESAGFQKVVVQNYGSSQDVLITLANAKRNAETQADQNEVSQQLSNAVLQAVPGAQLRTTSFVGSTVSSEMAYKGMLAVLVALIATVIYIALRFEYRLAIGAGVALVHDPVIILGVFSFFHIQFDLTALASVLTVIGYSLNDTIVVFDRVRENFRKMRKGTTVEIMNSAINQTLSRTIMTSSLTLLVVLALFFLGGPVIHGFALALIIGIVVGTYSSIYVAGATAVAIGLKRTDLLPATKKEVEVRP